MSAEKLAAQLEAILLTRIQSDQLYVPTMPPVAMRVLEVLQDPDAGMKEAAAVLEKDPMLAARTLRLATSAALRAGRRRSR